MLTIRQTENGWELLRDGVVLTVDVEGAPTATFARYEDAVSVIASMLAVSGGTLADQGIDPGEAGEPVESGDGLLPEIWESAADGGVAFCQATGDGRDFTDCVWSWRDPTAAFVPLMLQTETEWGHYGATLAGYATELFGGGNATVGARGRFFDSEAGEQFRDMLLSRPFTVSVDPGQVTWEDECLEVDDDGWCNSWLTHFLTYTIIGITGTPFAGFENAAIQLAAAVPVTASAAARSCGCTAAAGEPCGCAPTPELSTRSVRRQTTRRERYGAVTAAGARADTLLAPPASWFDDPGFVMPTPLTITNEGRVLGHIAVWNTCHTGHVDHCVTPPRGCDMLDFMQGTVITDDDSRIRTGVLTWMMEHPTDDVGYFETIAAYDRAAADAGLGWADVIGGEDVHGPWVSGGLRPGLSDGQLRILRALSLSGDWRWSQRAHRYELLGVLAVNYPGFPITAAARTLGIPSPRPREARRLAITAAGMVPQQARREPSDDLAGRLAVLERHYAADQRSRLRSIRREVVAERLRG